MINRAVAAAYLCDRLEQDLTERQTSSPSSLANPIDIDRNGDGDYDPASVDLAVVSHTETVTKRMRTIIEELKSGNLDDIPFISLTPLNGGAPRHYLLIDGLGHREYRKGKVFYCIISPDSEKGSELEESVVRRKIRIGNNSYQVKCIE